MSMVPKDCQPMTSAQMDVVMPLEIRGGSVVQSSRAGLINFSGEGTPTLTATTHATYGLGRISNSSPNQETRREPSASAMGSLPSDAFPRSSRSPRSCSFEGCIHTFASHSTLQAHIEQYTKPPACRAGCEMAFGSPQDRDRHKEPIHRRSYYYARNQAASTLPSSTPFIGKTISGHI